MYRMSIHERAGEGGAESVRESVGNSRLQFLRREGGGCLRSGLAVVLLDGDARVLGERLLELGDALFEGLLVRRLLDGRLDEAGLLARVRRDEKDSEDAVADREAPADVAARALGPRQLATARAVVGAD